MTKPILKYLLFFLPFFSFGQNNTYVGFEIGPKFEKYQYIDNGDGLYTKPFFFRPIYGITIEREINKTFTGEIGFYINEYGESYRIKGSFINGQSNGIDAYQIPFRLKARLSLIEDRLNITTTIGYTLAINDSYYSRSIGGSGYKFPNGANNSPFSEYNDSTRSTSTSNYSFKKTYGLIETGIALEYKFKNAISLNLAANYLTGFSKIIEIDVEYWINDGPKQTGVVFSNGDYFSVVLGIKYPINNLWSKKKE